MAIYHCSIKIISRGKGKSAVAAAAYRAAETITNDYDGITHDYTSKRGIIHTEIMLPEHAPMEYSDRSVLWNAVEKKEKSGVAQLAREIELALPIELTHEQNITLVREYVQRHFVSAGMCADVSAHDTGKGNPHAHILLTVRPINMDGTWGDKQKKDYILDHNGEKIYDPKKKQYKCKSIPTTDWNEYSKAEEWRKGWAVAVNAALGQNGIEKSVDHRSFIRQGVEQVPTVHMGVSAMQMERKGIRTERGDMNRSIEITNKEIRQLRARINKLNKWIAEETANPTPPTLYDVITEILNRQGQSGITRLKAASQMLIFLQENEIADMAGLERKVRSMYSRSQILRNDMKPIERRIGTLKEHIKQGEIYRKYKGKKRLAESEQILFTAARKYLNDHLNGHTLDLDAWKRELGAKNAERDVLYREYTALKEDTAKVEKIKRSVRDILHSESTEQTPKIPSSQAAPVVV